MNDYTDVIKWIKTHCPSPAKFRLNMTDHGTTIWINWVAFMVFAFKSSYSSSSLTMPAQRTAAARPTAGVSCWDLLEVQKEPSELVVFLEPGRALQNINNRSEQTPNQNLSVWAVENLPGRNFFPRISTCGIRMQIWCPYGGSWWNSWIYLDQS